MLARARGDIKFINIKNNCILAFHITKDYGSIGYPGGYPGYSGGYPGYSGGYPGYGISSGIGSVYPGTLYRGSSLIPGYRGYQYPGGLVGNGNIG